MGRFENQIYPLVPQDSGSPQGGRSNEVLNVPTQSVPIMSIQIKIPQSPPSQLDHYEVPQYEEEISVTVDK